MKSIRENINEADKIKFTNLYVDIQERLDNMVQERVIGEG